MERQPEQWTDEQSIERLIFGLSSATQYSDLLKAVGTELTRITPVDHLFLSLCQNEMLVTYHLDVTTAQIYEETEPCHSSQGGSDSLARSTGKIQFLTADDRCFEQDAVQSEICPSEIVNLSVPCITSGNVLGVLRVMSASPPVDTAQLEFFTQIATLLAIQLERLQLLDTIQKIVATHQLQTERLQVLNQIGRELSFSVTEEEVFSVIAKAVSQILPTHRVSYAFLKPDANYFEIYGLTGNSTVPKGAKVPLVNSSLGQAYREQKSMLWKLSEQSPFAEHIKFAQSGLRYAWSVPVEIETEIMGMLNVASAVDIAEPQELLNFLTPLGQFMGATISRIKIQNQATDSLRTSELKMEYQAYHDSLTKLPNRAAFRLFLEQAIHTAQREQSQLAIAFIDLDEFKMVNDSLSHAIGDRLLIEVAKRFQAALRPQDHIARLGGDEFVMVWPSHPSKQAIRRMAQRVINVLTEPFLIEGHHIHIGCSMGISIFPDHESTMKELLKQADLAMYQAKSTGNTFYFYHTRLGAELSWKLMIKDSILRAIEQNELNLLFQPQLDLVSGRVVGIEALVRWQHPQEGFIPPNQFIPIAEQFQLVPHITHWVLEQSLKSIKELHCLYPELYVAVNISAQDFLNPVSLIELIQKLLRQYKLPGEVLELEITENIFIHDKEKTCQLIQRFKRNGIRLALDDFGTGYSSLSYLLELPIQKIKIDRSFIQNLNYDSRKIRVVTGILALAQSLDMICVAEGVEHEVELQKLAQLGCERMQGYYYSPPVSLSQLKILLEQQSSQNESKLSLIEA